MKKVKILWVENEERFGPSIEYRIRRTLSKLSIHLVPEILTSGKFVNSTVRDWKPDIIMMDHNLEDVNRNGAELIIEIRLHNNETPIIYYSSEMGPDLMKLVEGEHRIFTCTRGTVHAELTRLLHAEFV